MKIIMTNHAKNDRIDRMVYIAQTIGFGERIVCESKRPGENGRQCVTENGIMIIKKSDADVLITAYIPTLEQVDAVYHRAGLRAPAWLTAKVRKNQKYAKGCPAQKSFQKGIDKPSKLCYNKDTPRGVMHLEG